MILEFVFYSVVFVVVAFCAGAIAGRAYYDIKLHKIDMKYNDIIYNERQQAEAKIKELKEKLA